MIEPRWLFPALTAALVTGIILGSQLWLLLLLIYLLYRVWTLHDGSTFRYVLLAALVTGMFCSRALYNSYQKPLHSPQPIERTFKTMPDQISINGNLVQMQGVELASGERELITLRLHSSQEKAALIHNQTMLIWRIKGQKEPIIEPTNFGQFDYQKYQWRHHVYNEVRTDDWQVDSQKPRTLIEGCHCLRAALHQYFQTLPAPLSEYCDSLIIGLNTFETARLLSSVKKLGVIHLFCISGMHVVLLIAILRGLLIRLRLNIETIDWLLIALLPFYLIIGGGAASLIRASIMAEVRLLSHRLRFSRVDAWSISLVIGILLDPYVLLTLGGQLSYLMSLLMPLSLRNVSDLKRAFWLNLVSLPSLFHYIYEVHLLSTLVSWLLIPLFGTVLFPLTLLAALTASWLPLLAYSFNQMLKLLHRILDQLAAGPGMLVFGQLSSPGAIIILLLTLWLLAEPAKKSSWYILAAAYCVAFLSIHLAPAGEVTFVDIGQGDCAIVRTPFNRQVVMIDTGGRLQYRLPQWAKSQTTSDMAARTSISYLKSRGITRLDAICLSHSDADHIGYLPTVLKSMHVKEVLVPSGMERNPKFKRLVSQPLKVIPVRADHQPNDLPLKVLHPFKSGTGKNEDSMVLAGRFGSLDFVFTGDLDRKGERAVIDRYSQLRADVLKLSHHGSRTGSDPKFLSRLQPRYGIISAGRFNRYGHPNSVTIKNLRRLGITPVSTQQYGMISYCYYQNQGYWKTRLKGDELKWMLPPYANS